MSSVGVIFGFLLLLLDMCFLTYYVHDFKGGFFFKGDDDLILMVVDSFYSRGVFAVTDFNFARRSKGCELAWG